MDRSVSVAILEPYYAGSHAAFVDALTARSRHRCVVASLPARKWKWRMRGAAIWFTQDDTAWMEGRSAVEIGGGAGPVELILCNDMLSVADLRACLPVHMRSIPIVCYFHENQLTYPIPNEQDRDFQYGMTNITSCLAADAVWFNSQFHLDDFLLAAGRLLRKMPDFVPGGVTESIRTKAKVFYPPITADVVHRPEAPTEGPLTILWPHRWEYDKNPERFFEALLRLDDEGYAFELVLLGEQFRTAPPVFASSWDRLKPHIVHAGFLPERSEYLVMLSRCDVVVSSAIQENFGIAVAEAIFAGCRPLLPNRLAYPELIPPEFHDSCLYAGDDALYPRLRDAVAGRSMLGAASMQRLQASLQARFALDVAVNAMDDELSRLVASLE